VGPFSSSLAARKAELSDGSKDQKRVLARRGRLPTFTADPLISERSLTNSHGQKGMLLTLSAVRSGRHSYHSQAESAGSTPVTRCTREYRDNSVGFMNATVPLPVSLGPFQNSVNDPWAIRWSKTPCQHFPSDGGSQMSTPTDPPLRAATGQSKHDGSGRRRHREVGLVI
jgi:hypothetical protein